MLNILIKDLIQEIIVLTLIKLEILDLSDFNIQDGIKEIIEELKLTKKNI